MQERYDLCVTAVSTGVCDVLIAALRTASRTVLLATSLCCRLCPSLCLSVSVFLSLMQPLQRQRSKCYRPNFRISRTRGVANDLLPSKRQQACRSTLIHLRYRRRAVQIQCKNYLYTFPLCDFSVNELCASPPWSATLSWWWGLCTDDPDDL